MFAGHSIIPYRLFFGLGIAAAAVACSSAGGEMSAIPEGATANSFAVVELFTSEGCSSCPPADDVLAGLVESSRHDGRRVFPIAFHVDYWNRLGWRDRFSSAGLTARQSEYARAFKLDSIYTPQMVVNGKTEFIGSDGRLAAKSIAAALSRPATADVSLDLHRTGKTEIKFDYTVSSAPAGTELNIVAVERGLTTKVARGENGGRTLRHENVARAFGIIALPPSGKGSSSLALPEDVDPANVSIVAFVQDPRSMEIFGAKSVDLPALQPASGQIK